MSQLDFVIEWEDPGGARGDELRATWARLETVINGECITRLYDSALNSVRTGVYLPLYPLAEWVVTHWWALLHECARPGQGSASAYARRHNLKFASEGFALPSLEVKPTGGHFDLTWERRTLPDSGIDFIRYGAATIEAPVATDSLTLFVNRVIARLDERGVTGTVLQEDWKAISEQDDDSSAFCRAAGAMGLDPFDLPAEVENSILEADQELPASVENEFFHAAEPTQIDEQREWVQEALRLGAAGSDLPRLRELRLLMKGMNGQATPWEQGYALARRFRLEVGLADKERIDLADLTAGDPVDAAITEHSSQNRLGFDALTAINSNGSPGFVIRKSHLEQNQRFAVGRALFEYLYASGSEASLISSAQSDRQKRNRAFAAELLAPAELIKRNLSGDRIGQTELDELAERFAVSSYVIEHQVQNHHLGWIL